MFNKAKTNLNTITKAILSGSECQRTEALEIIHAEYLVNNPEAVTDSKKKIIFNSCFSACIKLLLSGKKLTSETEKKLGITLYSLAKWHDCSNFLFRQNHPRQYEGKYLELIKTYASHTSGLGSYLIYTLLVFFSHEEKNHQKAGGFQSAFYYEEVNALINLFADNGFIVTQQDEKNALKFHWAMAHLLVKFTSGRYVQVNQINQIKQLLRLCVKQYQDDMPIRMNAPFIYLLHHFVRQSLFNNGFRLDGIDGVDCFGSFANLFLELLSESKKNKTYIATEYKVYGQKYSFLPRQSSQPSQPSQSSQENLDQPISLRFILVDIMTKFFLVRDGWLLLLNSSVGIVKTGLKLLFRIPEIACKKDAVFMEALVLKIYDVVESFDRFSPQVKRAALESCLESFDTTIFLQKMEAVFLTTSDDLLLDCKCEYLNILVKINNSKDDAVLSVLLQLSDEMFAAVAEHAMLSYEQNPYVLDVLAASEKACERLLSLSDLTRYSEQVNQVVATIVIEPEGMTQDNVFYSHDASVVTTIEMLEEYLTKAFKLLLELPELQGGKNKFYLDFICFAVLSKASICFEALYNTQGGESAIIQCFSQVRLQHLVSKIIAAFPPGSTSGDSCVALQKPYFFLLSWISKYAPILESILSIDPESFQHIFNYALSNKGSEEFFLQAFLRSEEACRYILNSKCVSEPRVQSRFLLSAGFDPGEHAADFLATQVRSVIPLVSSTQPEDFKNNDGPMFLVAINYLMLQSETQDDVDQLLNQLGQVLMSNAEDFAMREYSVTLANLLNRLSQLTAEQLNSFDRYQQAAYQILEPPQVEAQPRPEHVALAYTVNQKELAQALLKKFLNNWLGSYQKLMENPCDPTQELGVSGAEGFRSYEYNLLFDQLLDISLLHQAQAAVIELVMPELMKDFSTLVKMSNDTNLMSEHIAISAVRALLFLTMTRNPAARKMLTNQNLLPELLKQVARGSGEMQSLIYRMIDELDPLLALELRTVFFANRTFIYAPSFFGKEAALELQSKVFAPLLSASEPVRNALDSIMPNYLYGLTTASNSNVATKIQAYPGWEKTLSDQLYAVGDYIFKCWGINLERIELMNLSLPSTMMILSTVFTMERYLAEGTLLRTPSDLSEPVLLFIKKIMEVENLIVLPQLDKLLEARQGLHKDPSEFKNFLEKFLTHLNNKSPQDYQRDNQQAFFSILNKISQYEKQLGVDNMLIPFDPSVNPEGGYEGDVDCSFQTLPDNDGNQAEPDTASVVNQLAAPGCFYRTPSKGQKDDGQPSATLNLGKTS